MSIFKSECDSAVPCCCVKKSCCRVGCWWRLILARHLAKVGVGPAQQSRDDGQDSKTNCVALPKEPGALGNKTRSKKHRQDPIRKASDRLVSFYLEGCPIPGLSRSAWSLARSLSFFLNFRVQPAWDREKKGHIKKTKKNAFTVTLHPYKSSVLRNHRHVRSCPPGLVFQLLSLNVLLQLSSGWTVLTKPLSCNGVASSAQSLSTFFLKVLSIIPTLHMLPPCAPLQLLLSS